jgi:hypothetical protein
MSHRHQDDTGSVAYHATVPAAVRASHASLATFELRSCFHPVKDTNKLSLTYIMSRREVEAARAATMYGLAKAKTSETLNDWKLRMWTVSLLLSDLWYVNMASVLKKARRAARGGDADV